MKLLNDICRCQDTTCPKHQRCERWLQRNDGDPRTPQTATMRSVGECEYFKAKIDLMGECSMKRYEIDAPDPYFIEQSDGRFYLVEDVQAELKALSIKYSDLALKNEKLENEIIELKNKAEFYKEQYWVETGLDKPIEE